MSNCSGTHCAPVSALVTVYHRIKAEDLRWCLRSLAEQTLPAAQVVIVADGPLGAELDHVIAEFIATYNALLEPRNTGATGHTTPTTQHTPATTVQPSTHQPSQPTSDTGHTTPTTQHTPATTVQPTTHQSSQPTSAVLVELPHNQGAATASNEGLKHCTQDYIARLDADDIAHPTRFDKQYNYLRSNPHIHALGTAVEEFEDAEWASYKDKTIQTLATLHTRTRRMPETHAQIMRYMKINSPINHPASMIRRAALEEIDGYRTVHLMEDYDLWARLAAAGKTLHNLPEPLTYFRTSSAMFDRRTGSEMLAAERTMQANLRAYGLISRPRAILNLLIRSLYRALPRTVLTRAYRMLFNR